MKSRKISKNFKIVLIITTVLVGTMTLFNALIFLENLNKQIWKNGNINNMLNQFLYTLTLFNCLILLIVILVKKQPFNSIIEMQGKIMGISYILASVIFPRIEGYEVMTFEILAIKDITLIDGQIFVVGLLMIIFSNVIYRGVYIQEDLDSFI